MALFATLGAAWFAPEGEESAKSRSPPVRAAVGASLRAADGKAAGLPRAAQISEGVFPQRKPVQMEEPEMDLFSARSWYVPPPPPPPPRPVVAAPPPKPVPPALPFAFMGRLAEPSGESVTYLVKGNRSFPVRGGETLEGGYRVDKVGLTAVEFTYLPLNEKQILAIEAGR